MFGNLPDLLEKTWDEAVFALGGKQGFVVDSWSIQCKDFIWLLVQKLEGQGEGER